jgi:hypothetical protein
LRARPALGVSVGEQQSHHCHTEQNKTDRAHGSSPSPSFRAANAKGRGGVAAEQANEFAPLHLDDSVKSQWTKKADYHPRQPTNFSERECDTLCNRLRADEASGRVQPDLGRR